MMPPLSKILSLLLLCLSSSFAQETFLRRNLPMHSANISRISSDAQGGVLLSGSDDKTAKLWDAHTGALLQTYRVPISEGDDGMLYAAALSPDAQVVALAGWTGLDKERRNSIYLLNRQTGELLSRIKDLPNVIFDLEFSPDGQYLVAALGRDNGLRVFQSANWNLVTSLEGYGYHSMNIIFSSKRQLASICDDGYVRLYDASFQLITQKKVGNRPYSLTFSPDGKRLAIGFQDSPSIQVLDTPTLSLLYKPDVTGANTKGNHLVSLTFSADGNYLWAGDTYRKYHEGKSWFQLRRWSQAGKGAYQDFDASINTIHDLKALPNGDIWVGGSSPDLAHFNSAGTKLFYQASENLDLRANDQSHLRVNESGDELGFTPSGKTVLSFLVQTRQLRQTSLNAPSFTTQKAGISLTDWEGTYSPQLNGQALGFLEQYERCHSVDIGSEGFVLGAEWNLYAADSQGKKLWKTPTQALVWAVNITGNQQAVLAAMGDGTLRWYRLSDGKLLLTLYVHATTQQWILWTPSGYYDASAGAEDFIGWHINKGLDHSPDFFPISKFRNSFYRPDVIDRILVTYDESQALAQANAASNRKTGTTDITEMLPPTINIIKPSHNQEISDTKVNIQYKLTTYNDEPILSVQALVDGRPVAIERGMKPTLSININIPPRDCKISLIAENRFGYSEPSIISLKWNGATESSIPKPNLYILSIGVSKYQNQSYNLQFPAKDASDFVKVFQKQKDILYQEVFVKLLTNQEATKDNILDALEWMKKQATSKDIAMIFLAGHGTNDNTDNFYFLPYQAEEKSLMRTGVSGADIKNTVHAMASKIFVFADACHSGNMFGIQRRSTNIDMLVNELSSAENGAIVFTSSTSRQSSLEKSDWNNGAFTKALVEGLEGKADKSNRGYVSTKALDAYLAERVKVITDGYQAPMTIYPKGTSIDLPLVIIP